jgi:hypothetical protein
MINTSVGFSTTIETQSTVTGSDDLEESETLRGLDLVACALMLHRRPAPKRRNLDLTICSSRFSWSKRPAAIQAKKYHRSREHAFQSRGMVKLFIEAYSK